jgi:hypothetical protein
MTRRTASMLAASVTLLMACEKLDADAKKSFSGSNTCPLDRVESRERPELHPSMLAPSSRPPAEVARDPQRLAMWQQQQAKSHAQTTRIRRCSRSADATTRSSTRCHRFKNTSSFCMGMNYPEGAARSPLVP